MTDTEALVFVVDDDASLRASLQDLLESVGLRVGTGIPAPPAPGGAELPGARCAAARPQRAAAAAGTGRGRGTDAHYFYHRPQRYAVPPAVPYRTMWTRQRDGVKRPGQ